MKLSYSTPRTMYTTATAISSSSDMLRSESWKAFAVPEKFVWMRPGKFCVGQILHGVTASPSAKPGLRLKLTVTDGNWPV